MNDPAPPDGMATNAIAGGTVQLWKTGDRLWRYRYLHPGGAVIRSNRSFLTREEAVESASLAYPGIATEELARPPYAAPSEPWRRLAKFGMVTGGGGLLVIGLARVIRLSRRLARRAKKAGQLMRIASQISRRRNV